jgi:hypothetical protein
VVDHLLGQDAVERLFAAIATELQFVPASALRTSRVAILVEANNALVAHASLVLLQMEDHPGTFDPWCRTFAAPEGGP